MLTPIEAATPGKTKRAVLAAASNLLAAIRPSSQYKRDGAGLVCSALIAQAIQALSTPFLGRLYSPSAYGVWSLLLSAAAIPAALGGFRYELAITLSETDEEAANVGALNIACLLFTTILTAGGVVLWTNSFASALGIGEYRHWLGALPAIVFILGFAQTSNYWLIRYKSFRSLAIYRITQSLATAAAQSAAWPLWPGPEGLISGGVFGYFTPAILFLAEFWKKYRHLLRAVSWRGLSKAARKFRNFPRYVVPYGFVAVARDRGIFLLLGIYASTHVLGLYATAVRLAYAPVQLIAASLSPIVYRRACDHPVVREAAPMVYRVLKTVTVCTVPLFVAIAWFARDGFAILMGARWREAGLYASMFAIPASLQALSGPLDRMLDLVSRQKVSLAIEVSYSVLALAAAGLSLASGGGVTLCVATFGALTICYHLARVAAVYRFCGFPKSDMFKLGGIYMSLAGGTALILFVATRKNPWT